MTNKEQTEKGLVNDCEVKRSGDWYQCPDCKTESCILNWFKHCPMCATPINDCEAIYPK